MSDINGEGYGSEHDWIRGISSPFKYTSYTCKECAGHFQHNYDDIPDIFEAMKIQKVPENCEKEELV